MSVLGRGSDAISPTAHYTGHVWARNGLSHPALDTWQGRVLFETVRPAMILSRSLGGPTLESYLLARHRAGQGSHLVLAVELAGLGWTIALTHPGDRKFERTLKRAKNTSRYCPICRGTAR